MMRYSFSDYRKLLLGILLVLTLGAMVFLGILIFENSSAIAIKAPSLPASPTLVTTVHRSSAGSTEQTEIVSVGQRAGNRVLLQDAPASPSSPPKQEEALVKPVFYEVRPEKIAMLSEDQQWALKQTQEAYISYYSEWMRTYPRDTNLWNEKMKDFEQDLVLKLGPEGADRIRQ